MSPRAKALSRESASACSSTSPSEWATAPSGDPSIGTPPITRGSPASSLWESSPYPMRICVSTAAFYGPASARGERHLFPTLFPARCAHERMIAMSRPLGIALLVLITMIWGTTFVVIKDALDSIRSEEHTSELQSRGQLVCRLLLEQKKEQQQLQTHKR